MNSPPPARKTAPLHYRLHNSTWFRRLLDNMEMTVSLHDNLCHFLQNYQEGKQRESLGRSYFILNSRQSSWHGYLRLQSYRLPSRGVIKWIFFTGNMDIKLPAVWPSTSVRKSKIYREMTFITFTLARSDQAINSSRVTVCSSLMSPSSRSSL